jgi:hypothetical protein
MAEHVYRFYFHVHSFFMVVMSVSFLVFVAGGGRVFVAGGCGKSVVVVCL